MSPRNRTQVIEAELTWTGAAFETGVQVVVNGAGRIASVGPGEAPTTLALRGRALLPGFVNVHSHAFQRGLRGAGEQFPKGAGDFWSWREAMYGLAGRLDAAAFRRVCTQAFSEMRRAGITSVGEFHYLHHAEPALADFLLDELVLEAAAEVGIRLVLLETFYKTGGIGKPLEGAQKRFETPSLDGYWKQMDRLAPLLDPSLQSLGAVAHSIRAARPKEIAELHREARRRGLVFHMHVEEQPKEIEDSLAAYSARPMAILADFLDLSPQFTAVHCTHTAAEDMARFTAAGANVCICPLTEANLGDGLADLPAIHGAGGALCLGSDGNSRISMLEEMRWLEYGQRLARERRGVLRDRAGKVALPLWAAATTAGARSLGLATGSIAPGLWADFVAVDLGAPTLEDVSPGELAEALVFGCAEEVIAGTCVGGRWEGADGGRRGMRG